MFWPGLATFKHFALFHRTSPIVKYTDIKVGLGMMAVTHTSPHGFTQGQMNTDQYTDHCQVLGTLAIA